MTEGLQLNFLLCFFLHHDLGFYGFRLDPADDPTSSSYVDFETLKTMVPLFRRETASFASYDCPKIRDFPVRCLLSRLVSQLFPPLIRPPCIELTPSKDHATLTTPASAFEELADEPYIVWG